jgi:hypothetical protein
MTEDTRNLNEPPLPFPVADDVLCRARYGQCTGRYATQIADALESLSRNEVATDTWNLTASPAVN